MRTSSQPTDQHAAGDELADHPSCRTRIHAVGPLAQVSNPLPRLPAPLRRRRKAADKRALPRRRLSGAQVDELVELRCEGWLVNDIATKFGIHRDTVHRHLKRSGLAAKSGPLITGARLDQVAERYVAGESCAAIATDLDVDPSTITNTLRRAGISLRPRNGRA
ncbi:MAG: hypothetical protein AAF548_15840 [Actinomycetota bacterium]